MSEITELLDFSKKRVIRRKSLEFRREAVAQGLEANLGAFDDVEMSEWLVTVRDNSLGQFLRALSEAVLMATDEDYAIVRPSLMELKRKYSELRRKAEIVNNLAARKNGTGEGGRTAR
jgi:hypothetical protein